MTTHRTSDGDMVDAISRAHYGTEAHTAAIYDANPGLAARGPILPAGLLIVLPSVPRDPVEQPIRLWGK